ncbi:MAG: NOB1 family endonuclease [Candidatus Methanomethylophilaceae archaeon]
MLLILDSSALFSMEDLPSEDCLVPSGVLKELTRHGDRRVSRWEGLLQVRDPLPESIAEVREVARKSGDLGRLSDVDISILALAVETSGRILADDYSIQNVASIMGLEYQAVGVKGISKVLRWNYRCQGCGRWYAENLPDCPVCGAGMRSYRRK